MNASNTSTPEKKRIEDTSGLEWPNRMARKAAEVTSFALREQELHKACEQSEAQLEQTAHGSKESITHLELTSALIKMIWEVMLE